MMLIDSILTLGLPCLWSLSFICMLSNTAVLHSTVCCVGCLHSSLLSLSIVVFLLVHISVWKCPYRSPACPPATFQFDAHVRILEMFTVLVNGHGWYDLVFAKGWWCDILTNMLFIIPCGCNHIEYQHPIGIGLHWFVDWWIWLDFP